MLRRKRGYFEKGRETTEEEGRAESIRDLGESSEESSLRKESFTEMG